MMKEAQSYNYIETYLDELRSGGRYSFTIDELTKTFQLSDNAIKKSLQRLKQKNKVALMRKVFTLLFRLNIVSGASHHQPYLLTI